MTEINNTATFVERYFQATQSNNAATWAACFATDAPYTTEEGAETAVYLATLPDGGSQGGFFAEMRKFGGAVALPW